MKSINLAICIQLLTSIANAQFATTLVNKDNRDSFDNPIPRFTNSDILPIFSIKVEVKVDKDKMPKHFIFQERIKRLAESNINGLTEKELPLGTISEIISYKIRKAIFFEKNFLFLHGEKRILNEKISWIIFRNNNVFKMLILTKNASYATSIQTIFKKQSNQEYSDYFPWDFQGENIQSVSSNNFSIVKTFQNEDYFKLINPKEIQNFILHSPSCEIPLPPNYFETIDTLGKLMKQLDTIFNGFTPNYFFDTYEDTTAFLYLTDIYKINSNGALKKNNWVENIAEFFKLFLLPHESNVGMVGVFYNPNERTIQKTNWIEVEELSSIVTSSKKNIPNHIYKEPYYRFVHNTNLTILFYHFQIIEFDGGKKIVIQDKKNYFETSGVKAAFDSINNL